MSQNEFREIEHKFIVGDDFDLEDFRARVRAFDPERTIAQEVRDVYYLTRGRPGFIYRHRFDRELQHLSVKSLERDSEVRLEVNLDLGQHRGDQQETVEAFLDSLDVVWRGVIHKDIEVYYFPDCEIVLYGARVGESSVRCIEFEARRKPSVDDAIEILRRYEELMGFGGRRRTKKSLVEILFPSVVAGLSRPEETMNRQATFTVLLAKQDFKFSCAHFLLFDAETAELLHGHNYQVAVEVGGRALDEEGLLVDFRRVKTQIRDLCAELDSRTLVPARSRHLTVERRDGGVDITFRDRSYRFPESDLLLLERRNTSIEVLAKMVWERLAEVLEVPRATELGVSVSQTTGQECWYRAPLVTRPGP